MLNLHRAVVPKLFQTIEPQTHQAAIGMVLYDERENLLGYADIAFGPWGFGCNPRWRHKPATPKCSQT